MTLGQHTTRFLITGSFDPKLGLIQSDYPIEVAHRPQDSGVVYRTLLGPPIPGAHLLDRDDSRTCPICNPLSPGPEVDERKTS
jgi:hypothetical protein